MEKKHSLKSWIRKFITYQAWPKNSFELPFLQAHRGHCSFGEIENTLESIRKANHLGFKMFECDLQLSADQVPILYHDSDLQRLHGFADLLKNLTFAQLKEKIGITSLEEVLKDPYVPPFMNLELKTSLFFNEALERKVATVIEKNKAQEKVMFSSFNPGSLWKISNFLPEVPRALIVCEDDTPDNPFYSRYMLLAPLLKIHILHLDYKMLLKNPTALLSQAEENDFSALWFDFKMKQFPLALWTVNEDDAIEKLHSLGIQSIITDLNFPSFPKQQKFNE